MLHSQGVSLHALGIPGPDGITPALSPDGAPPPAPREVWRLFAANYHLFRGTPTALWFSEALALNFGLLDPLTPANAESYYDAIDAAIKGPALRPRALLDTFNIGFLATTNSAVDELLAHKMLAANPGAVQGRVVPTFRPDAISDCALPTWAGDVAKLAALTGESCATFPSFLAALRLRRAQFAALGATATDHGAEVPVASPMPDGAAAALFAKALKSGPAAITPAEAAAWRAHMLVEHARMAAADGLVMQLHAGVLRSHDPALLRTFGADRGGDIPLQVDWVRGLRPLLSELGSHPNFTLVLFTLDESTYSRELAPLAGVYPCLRLGAPWWFHDSPGGMRR